MPSCLGTKYHVQNEPHPHLLAGMDAVRKAASEAVESIRNSPLFRRKFGTYRKAQEESSEEEDTIVPEKDLTPFVQGVYYNVEFLGKQQIDAARAQDHGCMDQVVSNLWSGEAARPTAVSIRTTTTNVRVKEVKNGEVLCEFPVLKMSYCGTDKHHRDAFSFVAKEEDSNFYCYVFRCANRDKAHALAVTLSKAFYLAYQILQEQQGVFPPTPERDRLFEPQLADDTKQHPPWPHSLPTANPKEIPDIHLETPVSHILNTRQLSATPPPRSRPTKRPSLSSAKDAEMILSSVDDDFMRMAKARSNPHILRSTVEHHIITSHQLDLTHADRGSQMLELDYKLE